MTAPVFAVIVAGRLVQTEFQPLDETKFVTNIVDADAVNHIVVFLTGAQPFPEGFGGSVYFSWPDPNAAPTWQLLGFISNTKPSAIFKISKLKPDTNMTTPFGVQPISHVAQIGISIEPLQQLQLQTPITASKPSNVDSFMEFTTKMLENFVNFICSFAVSASQISPTTTETFVPIDTNLTTPFDVQPVSHVAKIGISIEPVQQLQLQTAVTASTPSNVDSFMEFTTKMLENFVNYVYSFTVSPRQISPTTTETFVPISKVQQWFNNFQRRLQQNPNFWKK
ncbi:protein OPI10 homolog [Caerostris darwini]|uniref:Protein OPI10 homolog n=1 Tax=Caerostris darwini TaxID=1538125 RepID=A0AAV4Q340_9ARAC|nr:protein OPI10 homolog [Caerostris darwini]